MPSAAQCLFTALFLVNDKPRRLGAKDLVDYGVVLMLADACDQYGFLPLYSDAGSEQHDDGAMRD